MPTSKHGLTKYRKGKGFTLIELIVVVTILAILSAMAVPSFRSFIANQKIKNISYNLVSTFVGARSEAMKRNANVVVAPIDGSNWQSGWTIATGGATLSQYAAFTGMTVICKSGTVVVTTCPAITYNSSGHLAGTASPAIQITGADSSYLRCISVDLSGRPRSAKVACP